MPVKLKKSQKIQNRSMNKIMLEKVINFPDLKNNPKKMDKDFRMKIFNNFNYEHEKKDFDNKLALMVKELGDDIQVSSKFFINSDLNNFIIENARLILDSEKIQQEFRLPFAKPLLLQNESHNNFTIVIRPILNKLQDTHFCVEFFDKDESNKISINSAALAFNKNIFCNGKVAYDNFQSLGLSGSHMPSYEWEHDNAQLITVTLLSYLCATNLQNDLNIFDVKNVKGFKGIKTDKREYSNRNFLSKPVYEHKVLNINMGRGNENSSDNGKLQGHKKRLHEVRGHLRKQKTGKICWVKDHKRGDKRLGVITKDYNLDYRRNR